MITMAGRAAWWSSGRRRWRPRPASPPWITPWNCPACAPGAAAASAAAQTGPLVPGHAVDALAEQVGVAVVAGVLLNHVDVDPAEVPHPFGMVAVAGNHMVQVQVAHRGPGQADLRPERRQDGRGIGLVEVFEIGVQVALGPVAEG